MSRSEHQARKLAVLAGLAAALALADSKARLEPSVITVQGGSATFATETNVPALTVKGKTTALEARVNVRRGAEGLQLDHIHARIPVETLSTGMGLRDKHMRKYIFTTEDGKLPDVTFESESAACPASTCEVKGNLSIRGETRPFTMQLKIREENPGFKVSCDTAVKLSDYGIPQPQELGVKTSDTVQLHFEFAAKPASGEKATGGGK
jgi:polyisoprenoid-binding protein YceI